MKWNEKFKSEKWNISCHINTQGCHNHQQFQPSSVKCWVLRAFRKKNTCYQQPWGCSHSLQWAPRELRMWKTQDTQIAEVHRKGMILASPDSHFPTHRKVLNPLTWNTWFSFINNDPLMLKPSDLCCGEGNGNPLQCSCLGNPRDRGTWWAAVYGGRTESDATDAT